MSCKRMTKNKYSVSRALVALFIGIVVSAFVFWLFSFFENREITEKDKLVIVEGEIISYKYNKGSASKTHHTSDEYVISIKNTGEYVMSNISLKKFDRNLFEQNMRVGDNLKLYVDENAENVTYRDGEIYEIWGGEKCYFSYEQYVKGFYEWQNEIDYLRWIVPLFFLLLGVYCAFEFWRKDRNQ